MTLKIDATSDGKLTFKNEMINFSNFHRLKNSDFILESKMAKLNKNKSLKQIDQLGAVRKLILPWKQLNSTINKTFYRIVVFNV